MMPAIKNPTTEVERDYVRFRRRIMREPICEPGPGQFVDECHYSKTGWAVWEHRSAVAHCTCRPALAPAHTGGRRND